MRQRYTGVILVAVVTLVSVPIPVAFNQLTMKLFILICFISIANGVYYNIKHIPVMKVK